MDQVRSNRRAAVATVAAAASAAALAVVSVPQTAGAAPASAGRQSVIVVLKDQLQTQPANRTHVDARRNSAHLAQSRILRTLTGPAPAHVINYTLGNAFSATVTAAQAAQIAANPAVASVVPDQKVQLAPAAAPAAKKPAATTTPPAAVDPRACTGTKQKPQLEPEALQTINARSDDPNAKTAASLGIDGSGVKVAYIADGINPANKGFLRKNGKSSIVDYKDFYGDGPNAPTGGGEAFGDASAISAQGNVAYDVADFANPSVVTFPNGHCWIRIVGVAPGANIVALKAGSELLPNSAILQAIDYAVTVAHVDVINESFGGAVYPDTSTRNTIEEFDRQAIAAGVTVTEGTSDAGITSTISNPATDPLVITAGASTDARLYEQTGYALAAQFSNGRWRDNNVSALSGGGVTNNGRTQDILAPGEADWAVCDDSGNFANCTSYANPNHQYAQIEAFGGVSQSAPITAGVSALVIQAYRRTHGGVSPSPAIVKTIITSTARDLGQPGELQGSGLIDAHAAVEAAFTWPGAKSPAPAGTAPTVTLSTDQLTLEGAPGTTVTGHVTVRNNSTKAQSIATSARRYTRLAHSSQRTFVNNTTLPTTAYPVDGTPWAYKKVTFDVPAGSDELAATVRWASGATYNGPGPVVRMSVFAPDGSYAANTRPQGGGVPSNYGHLTVTRPQAGTWTAVLYTPVAGGFKGRVTVDAQSLRAVPVGTISPSSAALAPRASTTVAVSVRVPSVGGDVVDTVSIGSSGGRQVAVPVVVRSVLAGSARAFGGTITGGNARGNSPAQTFSYAIDVPSGQRDLDVAVKLARQPLDRLVGVLIDPNDEAQSTASNETLDQSLHIVQSLTMQNTVANPQPGRWRYIVIVVNPVSGNEQSVNFTGSVGYNGIRVRGFDVPATLKAGQAKVIRVKVTNTGIAPMLVQTDARRSGKRTVQLVPQGAGSTIPLPLSVDELADLPAFLVPPDTSKIALSASSTVPAQVELGSPAFGIDVFGDLAAAQNGDTVSTATVSEKTGQVGPGYWTTWVAEIGPFGDGGAPAATSVLSGSAVTKPFDNAVLTSTGDPYLPGVNASDNGGAPLVIEPGSTGTVLVQITPKAAVGSTVNGVLHLVTTPLAGHNQFNPTGEVLANLPYSYTVR